MNLEGTHDPLPAPDYCRAVNDLLQRRYGTTISHLLAHDLVEAARTTGDAPGACVEWLAGFFGLGP